MAVRLLATPDLDGLAAKLFGGPAMPQANLVAALVAASAYLNEMAASQSAERQYDLELQRQLNDVAQRAQAAGRLSAMWSNPKDKFYKQRMAIYGP